MLSSLLLLSTSTACTPSRQKNVRVIDLVHDLPRADIRPRGARIEVGEHTFSGVRRASIGAPVPSRIIWTSRLPGRGIFRAWVAVRAPAGAPDAQVLFRVGISDHRIYEPLAHHTLTAGDAARTGWVTIAADLSLYGGWQWSVFHRPARRSWNLVVNAEGATGAEAIWGAPGVDTDTAAARDWWRAAAERHDAAAVNRPPQRRGS